MVMIAIRPGCRNVARVLSACRTAEDEPAARARHDIYIYIYIYVYIYITIMYNTYS